MWEEGRGATGKSAIMLERSQEVHGRSQADNVLSRGALQYLPTFMKL